MKRITNELKLLTFSAMLGFVVGAIVWLFLQAVSLVTGLIWDRLPQIIPLGGFYAIVVCGFGGLIIGILHKLLGDYPEELTEVMAKVKRDGHYDYSNMLIMLISAFLPLIFASSVGPEAGLTGVIVGLCYWAGDNLKYAKEHEKTYSEMGEAVTLGVLFHAPLFGILAVEENDDEDGGDFLLPKSDKLVLYGTSIAGGLLAPWLLARLTGLKGAGLPSFGSIDMAAVDYAAMLLYIPIGVIMCLLFERAEHAFEMIADKLPVVVKELCCGIVLGLVITSVPLAAFSGEEQMGELAEGYVQWLSIPWVLVGVGLIKLLLTAFCIRLGMKGGHFFPMIYACVCVGFGVAMAVFAIGGAADDLGHLVFAAGTVTAACLGAQMKKPLAVVMLLFLCFPLDLAPALFIAAAVGGRAISLVAEE